MKQVKPPETYAGPTLDEKGQRVMPDVGARNRSINRHLEVWSGEIGCGYTNNKDVFPKGK